ncbi:MAG: spore germination protein [Bacillota bacterium]
MGLNEPFGIIFGGFKINAMENTSSIAIGEVFYQALDSQEKLNIIAGQTYGDYDINNIQPINSPIFDPDGIDTMVPVTMSPLGLED